MNRTLKERYTLKYLLLFAMLFITFDLASNILIPKQIHLLGYPTTTAILIFPLTYLILDVVAEVYGYKIARQIIWFDLLCNFLFSFVVWLFATSTQLSSSHEQAYNIVLGRLPYIGVGAVVAGFISEFTNIYIISKLKVLIIGKYFWLRSLFSSAISMLLLLVIANLFAFYGQKSFVQTLTMSFTAYIYEVVFIAIVAFPVTFLLPFLKKAENIDVYSQGINFNPFKIDVD